MIGSFTWLELVMEDCRERRIVVPSPAALERLCIDLRHHARREVHRRLTNGLSAEQRKRLDALTHRREEAGQTWLTWLRQMPEAAKPAAMLGVIERLETCAWHRHRPGRGHLVHQARLAQLAREAGRSTVQHVADYERQRRHATLVAISVDLAASLTDQAVDLFDRLVGAMFRKAEGRHARAFQADARAINDKVRLFARVGAALITGRNDQQDGYEAIIALMPWEKFRTSVAEAEALARPEEFDAYQNLGEHYAGIRRWSPAFLEAFVFESVPASASLMRAIEVLREANRSETSSLPKSAPTGFVRQRWAALGPARRHHRPALLRTLRAVGTAGSVAGRRCMGDRQPAIQILRGTLDLLGDFAGPAANRRPADRRRGGLRQFIAARRALLDERMTAVDARATEGKLPDVTLTKGVLKISPIEKSTPPEAEALAARLYAMLPRIRITDLLAEVATWTLFPDCFTHLRTGETAADNHILMAGLLADGLNLGLTRMAEACSIGSLGQFAWTSDWHIRDETYAPCAALPGQPAAARTVRRALRQRHGIVIGWPVLPGCGLRS